MKQFLNKYLIGIFFVIGFILIPQYFVLASQIEIPPDNGGGGGCGGCIIPPPPVINNGHIIVDVNLDKSTPYTGSQPITAIAGGSIAVCQNTFSDLKVTGRITTSSGGNISGRTAKTILDVTNLQGGTLTGLYYNSNDFMAPTVSGNYLMRFEAKRYEGAGIAFYDLSDNLLNTYSYYDIHVNNSDVAVSTSPTGKIIWTGVMENQSYVSIPISDNLVAGIEVYDNTSGKYFKVKNISGVQIGNTITNSIPFSVGKPEVYVTTNENNIPYDGNVNVSWYSNYANNCVCKYGPNKENSCGTGVGTIDIPKGKMISNLKKTDTFSVTCDNLP